MTLTAYDILVCPANFVLSHRRPQLDDIVALEIRQCEQVNEEGVAVVWHGLFLGWILQEDRAAVWSILRDGGLVEGTVITVDCFYWANGGGLCTCGRIRVDTVGI